MTNVRKRDGTLQRFDADHIEHTIWRALCDIMPDSPLNTDLARLYTDTIVDQLGLRDTIDFTELGQIVTTVLDKLHPELSRAYHIYMEGKKHGLSRRTGGSPAQPDGTGPDQAGEGAEEPGKVSASTE